jgi:hypothetical protein
VASQEERIASVSARGKSGERPGTHHNPAHASRVPASAGRQHTAPPTSLRCSASEAVADAAALALTRRWRRPSLMLRRRGGRKRNRLAGLRKSLHHLLHSTTASTPLVWRLILLLVWRLLFWKGGRMARWCLLWLLPSLPLLLLRAPPLPAPRRVGSQYLACSFRREGARRHARRRRAHAHRRLLRTRRAHRRWR